MPECTTEFSKKKLLETFLLVVNFSNTILFHRKKAKKKIKNNSQSSTQTKIKPFYSKKFVITLVQGSRLGKYIPECTIEFSKEKASRDIPAYRGLFKYNFISQDKDKEKIIENFFDI